MSKAQVIQQLQIAQHFQMQLAFSVLVLFTEQK